MENLQKERFLPLRVFLVLAQWQVLWMHQEMRVILSTFAWVVVQTPCKIDHIKKVTILINLSSALHEKFII